MREITLTRPDDWHVHLRDGACLSATVADISRYFGRAIVMPNLVPPVDTASRAMAYRNDILAEIPAGRPFDPLMTLYLTPETTAKTVSDAVDSGIVTAFKLYPAGATTNSASGVALIETLYPVFEAMQAAGLVLCVHGEVTHAETDIFDREARFIDESLAGICSHFPALKVVFEHITTHEAVQFVEAGGDHLGATITAHHLLYNRNDMLAGGMKPLYYCLPVLKRDSHQKALVAAATSGHPRFFLGTDSAPHSREAKENACGCAAGSYTAHAALELYAEVFDQAGKLDQLENFASFNGPDFYGLPRNQDTVTLVEQDWTVPETLPFGDQQLVPIRCGEPIRWIIKESRD